MCWAARGGTGSTLCLVKDQPILTVHGQQFANIIKLVLHIITSDNSVINYCVFVVNPLGNLSKSVGLTITRG